MNLKRVILKKTFSSVKEKESFIEGLLLSSSSVEVTIKDSKEKELTLIQTIEV